VAVVIQTSIVQFNSSKQHGTNTLANSIDYAFGQLLHGYSVETTPGAATKIPDYRYILSAGTTVYVTLLPGSTIDDTLTVCERLASEGFHPVPHFAARQIPDRKKLHDALIRFRDGCGGTQALTLAGASDTPLGEFDNSMQLLETGLFDKMGVRKIGVAGHPEGSPDITDADIDSALKWKNQFAQRTDAAMYIVTQFCFEAQQVIDWERQLRFSGNLLPIHIGVPGVATIATLLKHAAACGIGNSTRYLKKHARNAAKLLTSSTPHQLLKDLAQHRIENPESQIQKIHVYPLGGLRKSIDWFNTIEPKTRQGVKIVA